MLNKWSFAQLKWIDGRRTHELCFKLVEGKWFLTLIVHNGVASWSLPLLSPSRTLFNLYNYFCRSTVLCRCVLNSWLLTLEMLIAVLLLQSAVFVVVSIFSVSGHRINFFWGTVNCVWSISPVFKFKSFVYLNNFNGYNILRCDPFKTWSRYICHHLGPDLPLLQFNNTCRTSKLNGVHAQLKGSIHNILILFQEKERLILIKNEGACFCCAVRRWTWQARPPAGRLATACLLQAVFQL